MRNGFRWQGWLAVVIGVALCAQQPAAAASIEAVQGKRYQITKQHGPWMIMVASFQPTPKEYRTEGLTPQEAADELVYTLRKKGIPAYTFSQEDVREPVETADRLNRTQRRSYIAQHGSVCVLAGNYPTAESRVAQKTLRYVKHFYPKFLRAIDPEVKQAIEQTGSPLRKLVNGGVYRVTPGRPGPLSGAFLTLNPLLSPEDVRRHKHSPLLMKLNSGAEYSLLDNPGEYTLIVASFYGKSVTELTNGKFEQAAKTFEVTNTLDQAAVQAWELTQALRQMNIEAWVWHDRYRSVVTVGSFNSPRDKRIPELVGTYGVKTQTDPTTQKPVLVAETLTIPRQLKPGQVPEKKWIFDPQPTLMEVPRLR